MKNLQELKECFNEIIIMSEEHPTDLLMFLKSVDNMLDDLRGEDAFGTEGQLDPRGDQRD